MTHLEPGRDDDASSVEATPAEQWEIGEDEQGGPMRTRRRPREEKDRRRRAHPGPGVLASVAAAGASGAATAGTATAWPLADRLLRSGLAATIAAAASVAPTWAVVVLSTGAAALGWTAGPLGATAGTAALLLAVVLVVKENVGRPMVLKAAAGALSATALLRVDGGRLGLSALATAALAGLIMVTGLRAAPRMWRRPVRGVALGLLGLSAACASLGAVAGLMARTSFERSSSETTRALDAARAGDAPAAATSARSAALDLREARRALGAWWARPAWALPIVGVHLRAADQVASSAGPAVEAAAGSAEVLRLDVLRPEAGRLDLDRLASAEPDLARLSDALHRAQAGSRRARSPWLVAPLRNRLDRYDEELASVTMTSDRALLAVQTLPRLLGAERPTRWFIAIGNPAESRELGGCVCEYAIVTADRGAIRLDRSGSVIDLGSYQPGRTLAGLDLPTRYLEQRPELYWQNLGGHPDLPTVATAARALWDQVAPGMPIDGVAYVDPHGLAALLKLTGPVAVPPPLGSLTAENAPRLLLVDQYARLSSVTEERKDILHEAAGATFAAISGAALPGPGAVGAALGPAVQAGHLLITTFDPSGQRLFDAIRASGRFPAAQGGDVASLRTSNLLANKLDAHLRRSVRYQAVVDPRSGRVRATATIQLRNEATADLPDYVAGNHADLPNGTNLLAVAWYSALDLEGVEVDGRSVSANEDRESGWSIYTANVTLPPGSTATVVVRLAGDLPARDAYRLAVAPQAAAYDDRYDVEVTGRDGREAGPVAPLVPGRRTDLVVDLANAQGDLG